jgi:hypothetical protein
MILLDTSRDPRIVLPQARAAGLAVSAVNVYTDDGGCGAFVSDAQVVADLHGSGVAVLVTFNGATVNGGDPSQAGGDARRAVQEMDWVPAGVAVGYDLERVADAVMTPPYLVGVVAALAARWTPLLYVSGYDPKFGALLTQALALDPQTMAKARWWLASWLTTGDPPAPEPPWTDPLGADGLHWSATNRAAVICRQYAGGAMQGTADLSTYGGERGALLWAPAAPAPPPPTPNGADPWAQASWAKWAAKGLDPSDPTGTVTREMLAAALDRLGLLG